MRSAAQSMRLQGVRKAWNAWAYLLASRQMLLRAAVCFRAPRVRAALSAWMVSTEEAHAVRERVGKAARSLLHTSLRRSFNSWTSMATHLGGLKALMASLVHSELRRAVNAWLWAAWSV